jgi:hypothetical protein
MEDRNRSDASEGPAWLQSKKSSEAREAGVIVHKVKRRCPCTVALAQAVGEHYWGTIKTASTAEVSR